MHTRPRVQRAPGIPCALSSERGTTRLQDSGETRREIANSYPLFENRIGAALTSFSPCGRRWREAPDEGLSPQTPPLRKQPLTRPRCQGIASTLSHRGRGEERP